MTKEEHANQLQFIKGAQKTLGVTRSGLAALLGVQPSTINAWLDTLISTGFRAMTEDTRRHIIVLLEIKQLKAEIEDLKAKIGAIVN